MSGVPTDPIAKPGCNTFTQVLLVVMIVHMDEHETLIELHAAFGTLRLGRRPQPRSLKSAAAAAADMRNCRLAATPSLMLLHLKADVSHRTSC